MSAYYIYKNIRSTIDFISNDLRERFKRKRERIMYLKMFHVILEFFKNFSRIFARNEVPIRIILIQLKNSFLN